MAYKTFTAGSSLPASEVQDYLMDQVVIVCTSGARPGSPVEGMTIYETDTDRIRVYSGTKWKPFDLGTNTYTPALTAVTTNPTLGSGAVQLGMYAMQGDWMDCQVKIAFGTSGTSAGSGTYLISIPSGYTIDNSVFDQPMGAVNINQAASGNWVAGQASYYDSTRFLMTLYSGTTLGANTIVGHNTPMAWTVSDTIFARLRFRAIET